MEAVGAIASIVQVAQLGTQISITLYKVTDSFKSATKEAKYIAKDIALFCTVLKNLADALEEAQEARIFRKDVFDTSRKICDECKDVFKEIEEVLRQATGSQNPLKTNFILPRTEKFMWLFRKGRVDFLRGVLESLKSTILVELAVLNYATKLSSPLSSNKVNANELLALKSLILASETATETLAELRRASTDQSHEGGHEIASNGIYAASVLNKTTSTPIPNSDSHDERRRSKLTAQKQFEIADTTVPQGKAFRLGWNQVDRLEHAAKQLELAKWEHRKWETKLNRVAKDGNAEFKMLKEYFLLEDIKNTLLEFGVSDVETCLEVLKTPNAIYSQRTSVRHNLPSSTSDLQQLKACSLTKTAATTTSKIGEVVTVQRWLQDIFVDLLWEHTRSFIESLINHEIKTNGTKIDKYDLSSIQPTSFNISLRSDDFQEKIHLRSSSNGTKELSSFGEKQLGSASATRQEGALPRADAELEAWLTAAPTATYQRHLTIPNSDEDALRDLHNLVPPLRVSASGGSGMELFDLESYVQTIIMVYDDAADVVRHLRHRQRKKETPHDHVQSQTKDNEDNEMDRLERSLTWGGSQTRRIYDYICKKSGHSCGTGDENACNEFNHILILLQGELLEPLKSAWQEDSAINSKTLQSICDSAQTRITLYLRSLYRRPVLVTPAPPQISAEKSQYAASRRASVYNRIPNCMRSSSDRSQGVESCSPKAPEDDFGSGPSYPVHNLSANDLEQNPRAYAIADTSSISRRSALSNSESATSSVSSPPRQFPTPSEASQRSRLLGLFGRGRRLPGVLSTHHEQDNSSTRSGRSELESASKPSQQENRDPADIAIQQLLQKWTTLDPAKFGVETATVPKPYRLCESAWRLQTSDNGQSMRPVRLSLAGNFLQGKRHYSRGLEWQKSEKRQGVFDQSTKVDLAVDYTSAVPASGGDEAPGVQTRGKRKRGGTQRKRTKSISALLLTHDASSVAEVHTRGKRKRGGIRRNTLRDSIRPNVDCTDEVDASSTLRRSLRKRVSHSNSQFKEGKPRKKLQQKECFTLRGANNGTRTFGLQEAVDQQTSTLGELHNITDIELPLCKAERVPEEPQSTIPNASPGLGEDFEAREMAITDFQSENHSLSAGKSSISSTFCQPATLATNPLTAGTASVSTSSLSSPLSTPPASPMSSPSPPPSNKRKRKSPAKSPFFVTPSTSSTPTKNKTKLPRTPRSSDGLPMSLKAFPPTSHEHFGIAQERLAHNPFQLLVAVQFLNKTRGTVAMPVFRGLMAIYPTAEALAAADVADIVPRIRHLGLQNQRAAKIINIAKMWLARPPERGKRYRTLHYPRVGDGKDIKPDEVLSDDDGRTGAWEIAHIPGCGDYAIDSWRIFCRDVLRGVAAGYNGELPDGLQLREASEMPKFETDTFMAVTPLDNDGFAEAKPDVETGFEPEWRRVLPKDKELRAYLRWMWLKHGWVWDPLTGNRVRASAELLAEAEKGDLAWREKDEALIIPKQDEADAVEKSSQAEDIAVQATHGVDAVVSRDPSTIPFHDSGLRSLLSQNWNA